MHWLIRIMTTEHSELTWYRKIRGGYWLYYITSGWHKVTQTHYQAEHANRMGKPAWSLEDNT